MSFPRAVATSVCGCSGLSGPRSYLMWQKGSQLRGQDNWPEGHFKSSLTPYQRETPAFAGLVGAAIHSGRLCDQGKQVWEPESCGFECQLSCFLAV